VIEPQVHGDRAHALGARRLDVVHAVSAREHALDGRGDEPAHEVGARAHVDGAHDDHRDVRARELPYGERADGLQPGDQDDEVDDDRQDRPANEQVGELHQLSSGLGAVLLDGWTLLFTTTAAPGRSLNTPEVATSWPGLMPSMIATWSPCERPSFTNCCRTPR